MSSADRIEWSWTQFTGEKIQYDTFAASLTELGSKPILMGISTYPFGTSRQDFRIVLHPISPPISTFASVVRGGNLVLMLRACGQFKGSEILWIQADTRACEYCPGWGQGEKKVMIDTCKHSSPFEVDTRSSAGKHWNGLYCRSTMRSAWILQKDRKARPYQTVDFASPPRYADVSAKPFQYNRRIASQVLFSQNVSTKTSSCPSSSYQLERI